MKSKFTEWTKKGKLNLFLKVLVKLAIGAYSVLVCIFNSIKQVMA